MQSCIHFSTTQNIEFINQSRHLLHEYYVNELGWQIQKHNASKIKIISNNTSDIPRNILVDDYDSISTWFVGLKGQSVIACARLCGDDNNGLLEAERYSEARLNLSHIFAKKKNLNLIELNREAIHIEYRNYEVYLLLLKIILQHCISNKQSILMTTCHPDLIYLYKLISFPKMEHASFKYDSSEPVPVNVYLADFNSNHHFTMLKNINYFLNLEETYDYKAFGITCIQTKHY